MSKFELSIVEDYVKDWTVDNAIREILQNAIDNQTLTGNPMIVEHDSVTNTLSIANDNVVLKTESLLLGSTTKSEQEQAIGQFGEGYKLALLVLTRNGHNVIIENAKNKEVWIARLVKSRRWNSTVLTINIGKQKDFAHNGVKFIITNVDIKTYNLIKDKTLMLKSDYSSEDHIKTPLGNILRNPNEEGRIYVNGLLIQTKDELNYGYDIKPSYLQIGRDRNLLDSCSVMSICSNMWLSVQDSHKELIHKMIDDGVADIQFPEYGLGIEAPYRLEQDIGQTEEEALDNSIYTKREIDILTMRNNGKTVAEEHYINLKEKYGLFIPVTIYESDGVAGKDYARYTKTVVLDSGLVSAIRKLPKYEEDFATVLKLYKNRTPVRNQLDVMSDYHKLRRDTHYYSDDVMLRIDILFEELAKSRCGCDNSETKVDTNGDIE